MRALPVTLAFLFGFGCSETNLSVAPDLFDDAPADERPADDGPANDPGDSDWDDLDPGSGPEPLFFVAWDDVTTGILDRRDPPRRFDVIDRAGRVVVAFEPPDPEYVEPVAIRPAGPGRTLVTTSSAMRASQFAQSAWIADAVTGEATEVARVDWGGWVWLRVDDIFEPVQILFDPSSVQILPDPTVANRLHILGRVSTSAEIEAMAPLVTVDLDEPDAYELTDPRDLFDPALVAPPEGGEIPPWPIWAGAYAVDGETELRLHLRSASITSTGDTDGVEPHVRSLITRYSPDEGVLPGVLELTDVLSDAAFTFRPRDEGGTVLMQNPVREWDAPRFLTWDGEELRGWTGGDLNAFGVGLGPVLDGGAPTFLHFGEVAIAEEGGPNQLRLSHRGEDILTWDTFQIGLGQHRFRVVALETVERP